MSRWINTYSFSIKKNVLYYVTHNTVWQSIAFTQNHAAVHA